MPAHFVATSERPEKTSQSYSTMNAVPNYADKFRHTTSVVGMMKRAYYVDELLHSNSSIADFVA